MTEQPDHTRFVKTATNGRVRGTRKKKASEKRPSYPRRALPELKTALAAVDALPEFGDRNASGLASDPALLLRKVAVLSDWMGRHGVKPIRTTGHDTVNVAAQMRRIGHAGETPPASVRDAIKALKETHGFGTADGRHVPECQIDLDLDRYEELVRERKKGPPRSMADPTQPCRIGAAREIPCDVVDLDQTCMKRLRRMMAEAATHGDIYQPTADDPSITGRQVRNPAVPGLLRASLKRYVDGLPADPLDPDEIDLLTVAWDAGVAPIDIMDFGDVLAMVRAARGDRPLQAHPMLAARRYTYKDLTDHGREARRDDPGGNADPGNASRASVAALTLFLTTSHAGGTLADPVPLDFAERVRKAIADRPAKATSGWMEEMRRWIGWNDALRASMPLPDLFALAMRILAREAGLDANDLVRATGVDAARFWLAGITTPSFQHAATLNRLDEILLVPVGTLNGLIAEEWRSKHFEEALFALPDDDEDTDLSLRRQRHTRHLPLEFADMSDTERQALLTEQHWTIINQDSTFARRQSEMSRDKYYLPMEEWPEVMRNAWLAMIPKPKKSVLLLPGEVAPKTKDQRGKGKRKDEWRQPTIDHRRELQESVFGYFTRQRKLDDDHIARFQARKTDFTPEAGLGIPVEHIHPVLFALPDLMRTFCHWRARRSGAENNTMTDALKLASEYLRPETGCVWKDEEAMLKQLKAFKEWWDANPHDTPEGPITLDIAPFLKNWRKAVKKAYNAVYDDFLRVRAGKLPKSRDPFMTVDVFVSADRPMVEYMKGIRNLLASRPHTTLSRHVHVRRCVQALILVQTALRTGTMLMTVSGKDPELRKVKDDEGVTTWRIKIAPIRFKNFDSPFFKDDVPYEYDLEDEDGLYALLDRYMDVSRPYLLQGRQSEVLFVNGYGGTDMDEEAMRRDYNMITRLHFVHNAATGTGAIKGAVVHGMHVVRHVVATHIVKMTGNMFLAACAIQDTEPTAWKHYGRFTPSEKARHAQAILKRARAFGRQAALAA